VYCLVVGSSICITLLSMLTTTDSMDSTAVWHWWRPGSLFR